MAPREVSEYMARSLSALKAAAVNIREGFHAVAVGCAYYAMFYAASAALTTLGIARSRHSGIIAAFGQHIVKPGHVEAEYGRALNEVFESRQESAYESLLSVDAHTATLVLERDRQFVERVEAFLRERGVQ